MQENSIGKLIKRVREEKDISQRQVCQGLCSIQTLSNIEAGERVPDVFLFENLLQRLGLSPDDFETVLFDDEYSEIVLRDSIEENLEKGSWEEAEKILQSNYSDTDTNSINRQYYYQIKALLESIQNHHEKSLEYIQKAIECTHPSFSAENLSDELFSTKELELLCMMVDEYGLLGNREQAKSLVEYLYSYITANSIQNLELVKTYPKIAYLYANLADGPKEKVDSISQCEEVFKLLIESDSVVCLAEIMEILIAYYSDMGLENRKVRLEKQLGSLKAMYEEFGGCIYVTKNPLKWFKESYRKEYLLCKEMIRGERTARGIKREELIEGIYEDPETLVRIENGHQNPSKKNYEALMRKLGMPIDKYNSPQISEGEEIFEIKRKILACFVKHDYESAKLELTKLELLVSKENSNNRQYLNRQNAMLEFELKQIDAEEFCKKTADALKETYAGDVEEPDRIPTLEERDIFNNLAISYWQMGRIEKGINLYGCLLSCYAKSNITEKYHFRSIVILLRNYLRLLEENDVLSKTLKVADAEIQLEIQASRAGGLDVVSSELMCIYEKLDLKDETKKKAIEKYLRHAFYISDLFMRKSDNKIYDSYYRENINNDIDWYI